MENEIAETALNINGVQRRSRLKTLADLDSPMHEKRLYNPDATEEIGILDGDSTNLLVLEDPKFSWGFPLYQHMFAMRWGVEDVNMSSDPETYNKLTMDEKEAFKGTLSFLAFLDSLQVNNTPEVASVITAPEVTICFAEQTASEALHSVTYQHIFESLKLPREEIMEIYYKFRDIPVLAERNKFIADVYQDYKDAPTLKTYIDVLIADLLLEGLYFYNGFAFFYNLASRGLTMGTAGNIKLINKDESTHVLLYQRVISEILKVCDEDLKSYIYERTIEMTEIAIQQEIEWSTLMYGDGKILGINNNSISNYTNYLAYKNIYRSILPKSDPRREHLGAFNNPYKHLDKIANIDGNGDNKAGFFETGTQDYLNVTIFDDFGQF